VNLTCCPGFPGHEHEARRAMLEVMGQEKYDFFFEKVIMILEKPGLR